MKRFILGILICLSSGAYAQTKAPELLNRAVHCLSVKNALPPSRATERTFGYLLDEKSYPGQRLLYVVNYPSSSRLSGFVFTIFLSEHDGHQDFNIQNNARFLVSNDGVEGVSFVEPQLGGTWTQKHLASAIKQIEKQPKFTILIGNALGVDSSVSCGSYADAQPKGAPR